MSKTLNQLRYDAHAIATANGFKDATVGEDIALMHSELSEALEEHRNGRAPAETWYEPTLNPDVFALKKPCGIPSEMADVIIRVLHFCGKHGIDIGAAVEEKMAYNATRGYRHGGKVL